MSYDPNYHSYLVRIWQPEPADKDWASSGWQGEVFHIQTGSKRLFKDIEELLIFIQVGLEDNHHSS